MNAALVCIVDFEQVFIHSEFKPLLVRKVNCGSVRSAVGQ